MSNRKSYTGIGSRAITKHLSFSLVKLGFVMALRGYRHLSGGAIGSDWSFHFGAMIAHRLMQNLGRGESLSEYTTAYLPWSGFNALTANMEWVKILRNPKAMEFGAKYHVAWDRLNPAMKKLMSRNAHELLGDDLESPTEFVFAYTPDGADGTSKLTTSRTGGTGQAIRMAADMGVPVRNIGDPAVAERMSEWVEQQLDLLDKELNTDTRQFIDYQMMMEKPEWANWKHAELVAEFMTGNYDAVIQCCNCQGSMGSGVAKSLSKQFPGLLKVNAAKGKGKSLLGQYSVLETEYGAIYNAYGQLSWGRDKEVLYLDYQKFQESLKAIHQFTRNKRVLIPMFGSGTANGCWLSIVQILRHYPDWKLTIVRM